MIGAVILKIAAPCNLDCSYCYVYHHEDQRWRTRPKSIPEDVYEACLERIRSYCETHDSRMQINFHGGEPLLVGRERFRWLVQRAREVLGERLSNLCVQTNGTLLDRDWAELLVELDVPPGLSLDGPPHVHDAQRYDHAGKGSYGAVLRGIEHLRSVGLQPGVLAVVQPGMDGGEVYRHFRGLGLRNFDFLLPDVSHDNKAAHYGQHGPTPVADYLLPALEAWMQEDDPDVQVRIFWNLFRRLMGGDCRIDTFSNPQLDYVVIETDGSIEMLDALRVCSEEAPQCGANVLTHDLEDLGSDGSLARMLMEGRVPLCETCTQCPEVDVCGGGYLPHRFARANGFDNPSVWCADIKKILAEMRVLLHESATPQL